MLATGALAAAQYAVDASAERFEQAGAYRALHPFLFCQSFQYVGDNEMMVNVRDRLHCQLQAGGRPSSLNVSDDDSPRDIGDILARFNNAPVHDLHEEPFIQDSGDNDRYYKWSRGLHVLTGG